MEWRFSGKKHRKPMSAWAPLAHQTVTTAHRSPVSGLVHERLICTTRLETPLCCDVLQDARLHASETAFVLSLDLINHTVASYSSTLLGELAVNWNNLVSTAVIPSAMGTAAPVVCFNC